MPPSTVLYHQVLYLFFLSIPVACIAWTVTHEEVFREPREYFTRRSQNAKSFFERKFFYLFTCEYCFSHYVVLFFLIITGYHFLYDDWRGYLIAFFSIVWVANVYMSLFGFIRIGMKNEKIETKIKEAKVEKTGAALSNSEK